MRSGPPEAAEPNEGAAWECSRTWRIGGPAPAAGARCLSLTLPLVISTGSWSLMMFADRMFLLWYAPDMMAATLPAGMLYWTMICFPVGLAGYVNTFVAQYYGARRPERIGAATWQGLRLGLYGTPLFLLAIPLAPRTCLRGRATIR